MRKPDKRPFTRVFSHTRRAARNRGARFVLSRTSRFPRDRYRSLFVDKRSPRVPRYFLLLPSFFILLRSNFHSPEYSAISVLFGLRLPSDPTYPSACTPPILLYFSRSAYFSSIYSAGWLRAAKGTMGRGCTKGDSSVYLRIAWRLSIEPFTQRRTRTLCLSPLNLALNFHPSNLFFSVKIDQSFFVRVKRSLDIAHCQISNERR